MRAWSRIGRHPKPSLDWADRAALVTVIKVLPHALAVRRLVAPTTVCAWHPWLVAGHCSTPPAAHAPRHMDDLRACERCASNSR
jgi:putative transposase